MPRDGFHRQGVLGDKAPYGIAVGPAGWSTCPRLHILNYFTHRYTNAFTDAANGISKLLQQTERGYGFEVMRIKLLYGKRGQAVDLSDYDADDGVPTDMSASSSRRCWPRPRDGSRSRPGGKRRGPSVAQVSRLVDEGYYDPRNKA